MSTQKAPARWVSFSGTVPAAPGAGAVHVATDAAADTSRAAGGYLATTGHYGARARRDTSGPSRIALTELRAVLWALQAVMPAAEKRPIVVHSDSEEALTYLLAWQAGDRRIPDGYQPTWRRPGAQPTLVQLQQLVLRPGLTFRHVRGHSGDPLNECADSLARLALRCSRGGIDRQHAAELAPLYAQQGLAARAAQH